MRALLVLLARLAYALVKPWLFRQDAEQVHDWTVRQLNARPGRMLRRAPHPSDPVEVLGIRFAHRVGLAAGFFKNPADARGLMATQYAFGEIGSITALAQAGNPKPRLFRFAQQGLILNRMGFNNVGAMGALARLQELERSGGLDRPYFVNIGKSKAAGSGQQAILDIAQSYSLLSNFGAATVINLASPNTPGLRGLMNAEFLSGLWEAMEAARRTRPILLKIHSDFVDEEFRELLGWARGADLDGIVCSNTTVQRNWEFAAVTSLDATVGSAGGISGRALKRLALPRVRALRESLRPEQVVVGCGGIMSSDDARAYLDAGAALVECYSGWIYGGPGWEERVAQGLAAALDK